MLTPARFWRYRAETSRVDSQESGAQRLAKRFPKNDQVLRYWPQKLEVRSRKIEK